MIYGRCWSRALICFILVWLSVLFYVLLPLVMPNATEEKLARQLADANRKLRKLAEENGDLRRSLDQSETKAPLMGGDVAGRSALAAPSDEYETLRRRLGRDVVEMWRFIGSKPEDTTNQREELRHRYHAIVADFESMTDSDGHAEWRKAEVKQLSDLVQGRLRHLQNPRNCSSARKLVCKLNKGCGYGCQIHHVVYCFIIAYGTERTLILKSKGWRYNKGGFEEVFKPLSDSCLDHRGSSLALWPGSHDTQVVNIPIVDSINPRPKFLPPAIPADLAPRIVKVHGDPIVWWVSEFLRYILRPQQSTSDMLKDIEGAHDFERPLVGIHVRRTDKVGTEAAFHGIEEYMKHVEDYFAKLEAKTKGDVEKRNVYVASDDSKVLAECRKKYPNYTFHGDHSIAKSAAVSSRYNLQSLKGVIADIHMLSLSDHLVCTFSSQVCRIAYELQQQRFVDGSANFDSLDDIWYFGGQNDHQQEAIYPHKAAGDRKDEIKLSVGDVIGVAGNHWNGFNKGRNYATNRIGLYPEYKTAEKLKVVDFPTYPDAVI